MHGIINTIIYTYGNSIVIKKANMKRLFIPLLLCAIISIRTIAQNIAINSSGNKADISAMLDVQSTTKGMLIPRMSATERASIAAPATGLLVFDNTTGSFWFKKASRWVELIDSTNTIWTKKDANVYLNNGENVGIGTNTPDVRLQIDKGTDATASGGGYLQLGETTISNIALDNNEMQARNNGNASTLYLQRNGGDVEVGSSGNSSNLNIVKGKLITPRTGSTNTLIPLCYGKVSNSGALVAYTDNVSLYRTDGTNPERYYEISCSGINVGTVMTVTPNEKYGNTTISAVALFHSPGVARIYILQGLSEQVYADFSFIFYNQ